MLLASGRLALFIGIHVSLAVLGFAADHPLVWVAVWLIQSINMLTLVGVVHESVHQHFFPTRRASRIAGTVSAAFGLTCFEAYRAQHVMHHAHTCDVGDTEGEPYKFTARWQIVGAFLGGGVYFTLLVLWSGIRVSFGWTPDWITSESQRRRIRLNVAFLAALAMGVIAVVQTGVVSFASLAAVWFVPALVSLFGPLPYVLLPEHYDAPGPGSTMTNTRTCVSNPVLRFVYLNTNLHTAHHDRPSVPWHDLTTHHQRIEDDIAPDWIFPSYAAFHRWMWNTTSRPAAANMAS